MSRGANVEPSGRWISPDPPMPVRRPVLFQGWRDIVFLHWPCDPTVLRPHVPGPFSIETVEGRAWASVISFRMEPLRLPGLPPIPGVRRAFETHLRTYVRAPDGTRGLWFLSLDIAPLPTAAAGRFPFFLPYWWARHRLDRRGDVLDVRMDRRLGSSARHRVRIEAGPAIPEGELGHLDHFLTARWILYTIYGPVAVAFPVEHPRWPLRRGSVLALDQNLLAAKGITPLERDPMVHVTDALDARIGWPRRVRS